MADEFIDSKAQNELHAEHAKGEPYGRVKEKARYMAQDLEAYEARAVIQRLIESAPQQTLDALCEVLDPDATT